MNYCYCNICKTLNKIKSFKRDNPVLSCGHIKYPTDIDIDKCRNDLLSKLESSSVLLGVPVEDLKQSFFEALYEKRN